MSTAVGVLRRHGTLTQSVSFVLDASILLALLAASSAPTPLYTRYQHDWHLSALMVTIVFSAYPLALLASLLVTGSLSDYLGRRSVLFLSLLAEAGAMIWFTAAHGVASLIAARILQGLATGSASAAAGAALLDAESANHPGRATLTNSIAPAAGMASGVLVATLLVQYAPAPTHTVYLLLLAVFLVQAAGVAAMPETRASRPGVLRALCPRVAISRTARPTMLISAPALVGAWALGGLYSSLGPVLARFISPNGPAAAGGLVFFAMTACATATAWFTRPLAGRTAALLGAVALLPGAAATLAALDTHALPILFVGTVCAGLGFGAVTQGVMRMLLPRTGPEERAGTLAAYYVLSYLAMSLPAMGAGVLATTFGLAPAVEFYAITMAALAVVAIAFLVRAGSPQHHQHGGKEQ